MLRPQSEVELAALIGDPARGAFRIVGGGTQGMAEVSGEALSISGLSGISLYEPGALTIVAGAGTPLEQIDAALSAEGQMLAFEPMDCRSLLGTNGQQTVGGMSATNLSGPRRIQAGACRDAMLGVRFVDGTGAVVKNGGRVMKNVTGYDLVKLMAGARGTLGVLTEVAFKVLPRPETTMSVVVHGLSDGQAVAAMARALGSPYDVTGAAHVSGALPRTFVRVEGFETSTRYRAEAVRDVLAKFGEVEVVTDPGVVAADWRIIRDVAALAGEEAVWRVSLKPSDAPSLLTGLPAERLGAVQLDWGGGLIWIGGNEDAELGAAIHAGVARLGGNVRLVKATAGSQLPRVLPQPEAISRIEAGLRARFDPLGRLNPGLMRNAA